MNTLYRLCERLKRPLGALLYGFALLDLVFLLLSIYLSGLTIFLHVQEMVVNFSLGYFLAYWLIRWTARRFSITQLRLSIIDFVFIVLGFAITNPPIYPIYLVSRQLYLIFQESTLGRHHGRLHKVFTANPAVLVLLTFIAIILVGTFLLMLPFASMGQKTSFIDALFTSTSATCVTGLTTLDTGTHFTLFGQIVILLLIQVGGLGLMTVSTVFAIALGQRITLKGGDLMKDVMGERNHLNTMMLVKGTAAATLGIELIGAVLLYLGFPAGPRQVFNAVFHSVSAFCNAGFSLYPDNMMHFLSNDIVNFTIMGLIVFGGIGFSVITDIRRHVVHRFQPRRLGLHTKIVVIATAALILIGFIGYYIAEYNNTMRDLNLHDRCLASLFQSVTTRTAGYNTIDNSKLTDASVLLSLFLMYVGASPGSTGGGVKTSTFAVMFLTVMAIMTSNGNVTAFKRRIGNDVLRRVTALIALSLAFLIVMIFALMCVQTHEAGRNDVSLITGVFTPNTQPVLPEQPKPHTDFSRLVFEAFSAFGTVGLSMGVTPNLAYGSKIIIILLMYIGRVGPLTFIFAVSSVQTKKTLAYTEENISIG
jgi:trk system potassium uptake protein TrkH